MEQENSDNGKNSSRRGREASFSLRRRKANFKGQVEMVGDFPRTLFNQSGDLKHSGVILRTKQDRLTVHLGPARYSWEHNFPIKVGDVLEISGSKMTVEEFAEIVVADKVRRQGKTLIIPETFA